MSASCATNQSQACVPSSQPWLIAGISGRIYSTAHYRICTTVNDPHTLDRFMRLMEAAHAQYEATFAPANPRTGPMEIDLLSSAAEFDTFTRAIAGPQAPAYLRVGTGGYAIGDRFVCRLTTEAELFPVAAHEGFHQYMAHQFRRRLPPSLEEGLATTFESVSVGDRNISSDREHNPRRENALRHAVATQTLIPLDMLIELNAGDVAGRGPASEGYYAQCWALARMIESDSVYHEGMRKLVQSLNDVTTPGLTTNEPADYLPAEIRPTLEKFVVLNWRQFEDTYIHWLKIPH